MKCKYDNNYIIAYNEGQLPDAETEEFKEHVKTCDRCAKKIIFLTYTENYFRQDIEGKHTIADNVMASIDNSRYSKNTILTKATVIINRNKSVCKTVFPVTAAILLAVLVLRYNSLIIDMKDNFVASIKQIEIYKEDKPDNNSETQNEANVRINETFSVQDFLEGKEFVFAGLPVDIEENDVINKYGKPQIYHSGESFEDRAYTDNSIISYFGVDINNKVKNLKVSNYYKGSSSKGIKINSSKEDLLEAYGSPDYVYENENTNEETYYYGENERYFIFHLENNCINSMGWLVDDDNHYISMKLDANIIKYNK
ncbi:MAG: hypothetical protein GX660_10235 [Clostridiaceae bacterium]|nr:hypothetical protein [Clostridiaceae bacterium]